MCEAAHLALAWIRVVLAAGAVLLLVSCAQGEKRARDLPASATAFYPDRAQVMLRMSEYLKAVGDSCFRRAAASQAPEGADLRTRHQSCLLEQISGTFGNEAETDEHCRETDLVERFSCVWFSTAAWRLIAASGSDPRTSMKWSDTTRSLALGAALLETRARSECAGEADNGCMVRRMGAALLLPSDAVAVCAELADRSLQAKCIAAAFFNDLIDSALLYAG
ncbi:MAG: hypothetical protein JNN33_05905 [Rhodospirillaceae bacterium]|nr:hypothetical protein [Rhodospirillaceae bacterium]